MQKNRLYVFLFCLLISFNFYSCGGGDGESSVSPEVEAAMADAGNTDVTFPFLTASGSIAGLRERIVQGFPEVETLIGGGTSARDAMLAYFTGTPSFDSDVQLAIFAYALEQMGDTESVPTLVAFLTDNITGDLCLTPQFVTNAIRLLSGETSPDGTYEYLAEEMQESLTLSASEPLKDVSFAGSASSASCSRQYLLVDGSGNVITYVDENNETQFAVVGGVEFSSSTIEDSLDRNYRNEVERGDGTYVTDDAEFPGAPSKQFNCAGYAFRSFNGGNKWVPQVAKMFDMLVTKTGLLVEVNESDAQPGDKVFYWQSSSGTMPDHVAEVQRIDSGYIYDTIVVRNADSSSGLWEAAINAAYFTGSWISGVAVKYPYRKVYRWASGSAPSVIPDPRVASNSAYCGSSSSTGFTASISITGYSISFDPTVVRATNAGSYTGDVVLTNVVGILAGEGMSGNVDTIALLLDRRQITGTGTYDFNEVDKVFDDRQGEANITYSGPTITNADDGTEVVFESTSGTVTLTSYGTSTGDTLKGSYLATVSGNRDTGAVDGNGSHIMEILTGTISGSFEKVIE